MTKGILTRAELVAKLREEADWVADCCNADSGCKLADVDVELLRSAANDIEIHDLASQALREPGANLADLIAARQMLRFLRDRDGECLGDHPDWIARIDAILDGGERSDALRSARAKLGACERYALRLIRDDQNDLDKANVKAIVDQAREGRTAIDVALGNTAA